MARLDRFLLSPDFDSSFPQYLQTSLPSTASDHCPIMLNTKGLPASPTIFRLDKTWLSNKDLCSNIRSWWTSFSTSGNSADIFAKKLQLLRRRIKTWKRQEYETPGTRKKKIEELIEELQRKEEGGELSQEDFENKQKLKGDLLEVCKEEEDNWRLRSRITWLAEGDNNTSFFHNYASANKRRNFIYHLENDHGNTVFDEKGKQSIALNFYRNLLGKEHSSDFALEWDCLYDVCPDLSGLDECFTEEECRKAVFGLHPDKSAGPDGFGIRFYQAFWPTIKKDLMALLSEFYVGDRAFSNSLSKLNQAAVTLIPKGTEHSKLGDFRPISLVNCSIKIISKILATRLQSYIHLLVDDYQSAFQ